MDYSDFQCDDFVADPTFRRWVLRPDEASSLFWQTYQTQHPEQAVAIGQAVDRIRALSAATGALNVPTPPGETAALWQLIRVRALAQETGPFVSRSWRVGRYWLAAAALLALVLGLAWQQGLVEPVVPVLTAQKPVIEPLTPYITAKNTSRQSRLINLPDGSSLLLRPNSQVRFARELSGPRRVVHLSGEAFFEVAKDANHPFFVYANGLITKALGTSFTVRAYAADAQVVVTVRSGRVAVYAQTDRTARQKANSLTLEGTVLRPNQQLVFARNEPLIAQPTQLDATTTRRVFPALPARFVFDAVPVSEVFTQLEQYYGIQISYDKARLGTCRLTADLSDEPLPEKMLIICKSLEASYTISNDRYVVAGPGCQP